MSMCRVFSCVVGRRCLQWPVCFLGKTLLAFAVLHSVLQGQICLLLMYFLTFYFCIPVPYNENTSFIDLVLEALLVFIEPLNFSFFSISGWGIDLDYCDIEWFSSETRSFCHFWDCIQVLHFRLFCWLWWLLHFFLGILAYSSRYKLIWGKFTHSSPF